MYAYVHIKLYFNKHTYTHTLIKFIPIYAETLSYPTSYVPIDSYMSRYICPHTCTLVKAKKPAQMYTHSCICQLNIFLLIELHLHLYINAHLHTNSSVLIAARRDVVFFFFPPEKCTALTNISSCFYGQVVVEVVGGDYKGKR